MAEKRMFSKKIIDTDWFMDMPASTQNLYFHLSMRADDDGFVANPKRIIKLIGANEDDYKLLIAKKFIIPFESGICVITDWRVNNYLRNDRYTETIYQEEKKQLLLDNNGKYEIGIPNGIPVVATDISISNSNSKSSSNTNKEEKHKYGEYKHVLLTDTQYNKLVSDFGEERVGKAIKKVDEYVQTSGKTYKDYNLVLRKWGLEEKPTRKVENTYSENDLQRYRR